jgi:hypothetical protein
MALIAPTSLLELTRMGSLLGSAVPSVSLRVGGGLRFVSSPDFGRCDLCAATPGALSS